jgi:NADPH:quinone reductase-like Zn-dependent oxidoreductase
MVERAGVKAGERVLVTGASGGVGSAAVQLAARRGAHVVALCAREKAAEVLALGAAEVLPRDADLKSTLGTESIDAVIDGVGGAGFPILLDILKRGGRYAAVGAIAGPVVELDLRTLYLKDLSLFGCTVLGPEVFQISSVHRERRGEAGGGGNLSAARDRGRAEGIPGKAPYRQDRADAVKPNKRDREIPVFSWVWEETRLRTNQLDQSG